MRRLTSWHRLTCRQLVELVTDYLEDALSPRNRTRLERHLAGCPGCRAYLSQMRHTMRLLGGFAAEGQLS